MAKKFSELRAKMSPEARSSSAAATQRMLEETALAELREMKNITQQELAERLEIGQGEVSKMERRADMHLSTLSNVIEAMGGKLQLRAQFPNGDVHLISLADGVRVRRAKKA